MDNSTPARTGPIHQTGSTRIYRGRQRFSTRREDRRAGGKSAVGTRAQHLISELQKIGIARRSIDALWRPCLNESPSYMAAMLAPGPRSRMSAIDPGCVETRNPHIFRGRFSIAALRKRRCTRFGQPSLPTFSFCSAFLHSLDP